MRIIIDSKDRRDFAKSMVGNIKGEENMEVIIQPHIDEHSISQRSLFHVMCREWGNQAGYTEGQVKEAIKTVVYGTDTVTLGEKAIQVVGSTERTADGKLRDKTDYSELIEHTFRLAAESGVVLDSTQPLRHS